MSQWDEYGVCPCGFKTRAPFGNLFFITGEFTVCPKCGRDVEREWEVKTMRFVSKAKLLRPSTWSTGEWQELGGAVND